MSWLRTRLRSWPRKRQREMRVRATDVDIRAGSVLQRSDDDPVAADIAPARVHLAGDHLGGEMLARRDRASPATVQGECGQCRWGKPVRAFATDLIRCENNSQANVPQHSCGDYEPQPETNHAR